MSFNHITVLFNFLIFVESNFHEAYAKTISFKGNFLNIWNSSCATRSLEILRKPEVVVTQQ